MTPMHLDSGMHSRLHNSYGARQRFQNSLLLRCGNSSWTLNGSRISVKIVGSSAHWGVTVFAL